VEWGTAAGEGGAGAGAGGSTLTLDASCLDLSRLRERWTMAEHDKDRVGRRAVRWAWRGAITPPAPDPAAPASPLPRASAGGSCAR
jgi:hypothetical protein